MMGVQDIACICGETNALRGDRIDETIRLTCESCGYSWTRNPASLCGKCGSEDLQTVPLAIVEKGRGTQLSVVGVRSILLCSSCDKQRLREYHDHRPNPLMPGELPTVAPEERLK